MHKIARRLALTFVLLQSGAMASAQTCDYAGQTFSPGATICECPSLRVIRNAGGGRGEITSRRLACSENERWVNANSLCLIAYTWPEKAEEAFRKFHAAYCPHAPVGHAETRDAIREGTEKLSGAAGRRQALIAVQAICRRFTDLSAACQAMIQGLSSAGN
jgi:hypothetical protein